jgi:hypothetical protein
MTQGQAITILEEVKREVGRTYKSKISTAWQTGCYAAEGLERWACELQNMRNIWGPSWLRRAKVV